MTIVVCLKCCIEKTYDYCRFYTLEFSCIVLLLSGLRIMHHWSFLFYTSNYVSHEFIQVHDILEIVTTHFTSCSHGEDY